METSVETDLTPRVHHGTRSPLSLKGEGHPVPYVSRGARSALVGLLLATAACTPPVVRNCDPDATVRCPELNEPHGRIEGTVIYHGPPPTRGANGVAAGRVLLLLFAYDNPPPPAGTATTAVSFQSIDAADLFRDPTVDARGNVFATIPYSFPGIVSGGVYQIRAFYSRGEEIVATIAGEQRRIPTGFHPLYSVRNLPVRGDVGGGALEDPDAAIPRFRPIVIGDADGMDDHGRPRYVIPDRGAVAHDVTVFIGQVFPLDRPMFQALTEAVTVTSPTGTSVTLPPPVRFTPTVVEAPPGIDQTGVMVPPPSAGLVAYARATGLLPTQSPVLEMVRNVTTHRPEDGADLPSFSVRTSLPPEECDVAALAGVRCPVNPFASIGFVEFAYDRNENGVIDLGPAGRFADVHPTLVSTNALLRMMGGRIPWLYPLVVLSRLHDPTPAEELVLREGVGGRIPPETYARLRASLNRPEELDPANQRFPVLVFGTVVPDGSAAGFLTHNWAGGYRQAEPFPRIAIVPIAVEVHGPDPARDWWAIVPPSPAELGAAALPFLPQNYRCDLVRDGVPLEMDAQQPSGIPPGRYAVTLIGPGGQAWTSPNELAGFATPNAPAAVCPVVPGNGTMDAPVSFCRAPSQGFVVRIRGLEMSDGVCPMPACRGEWCNMQWPRP
jgi:hypothetical protein